MLSSGTTEGSFTPSSIFQLRDKSKTNTFSSQLKKLCRDISLLESKVLADLGEPQDESRIDTKGCPSRGSGEDMMHDGRKRSRTPERKLPSVSARLVSAQHVCQPFRVEAPNARVPELFVFLPGILYTNIQLDHFSASLVCLLERLDIEEPEGREWTMMAAVNFGALLEYGQPQGVLRRAGALGQADHNPAAIAAAIKVRLARKAQAE